MKKVISMFVVTVMLIGVIGLSACATTEPAAAEQPTATEDQTATETQAEGNKEITIGVSLLTREHVFWNIIEENLVKSADAAGVKLNIQDGKSDTNVQYDQVQNFITEGVDAIVMAPADSSGSSTAAALAKDANIPFYFINIKGEGEYDAFVGTDEITGGKLAGEYAAKYLNGKGKVAIITYDEISVCVQRAEGFKQIVEKYPEIEIVTTGNYSGDTNKAASVTQDFLALYPDLDLIFAVGDPAAVGATEVIKTQGANTKVIGYDGNPESVTAIKSDDGIWIADVAQDPAGYASKIIELVVAQLKGDTIEKEILIPPYIIDMDYIKANNL